MSQTTVISEQWLAYLSRRAYETHDEILSPFELAKELSTKRDPQVLRWTDGGDFDESVWKESRTGRKPRRKSLRSATTAHWHLSADNFARSADRDVSRALARDALQTAPTTSAPIDWSERPQRRTVRRAQGSGYDRVFVTRDSQWSRVCVDVVVIAKKNQRRNTRMLTLANS